MSYKPFLPDNPTEKTLCDHIITLFKAVHPTSRALYPDVNDTLTVKLIGDGRESDYGHFRAHLMFGPELDYRAMSSEELNSRELALYSLYNRLFAEFKKKLAEVDELHKQLHQIHKALK